MRDTIVNLRWRRIIIFSIAFSMSFLIFTSTNAFNKVVYGNMWVCQDGGTFDCTANGCKRYNNQPDGYWVCNYSQAGCPPLELCNP